MKMQISTDYAIRILLYLHENRNEGEVYTAMHISVATGITYAIFTKLINLLKKKGLVKAAQGKKGGYTLGLPANEISLYDVFLCIEGELQINRCLKNDGICNRGPSESCAMHCFFYELQGQLIAEMSGTMIADLAHTVEHEIAS